MASAESLTHAFMRAHPGEAAEVLGALPAGEAAAFFARAPARIGAPVLGAMQPAAAARVLAAMEEERALEFLGPLSARQAAALLRRSPELRRERFLERLPAGRAVATRVLLGQADDTVGAWVDPEVVALSPQARAGEALEHMRRGESRVERVYVVSVGQRVLGAVSIGVLLRAGADVPLESLLAPAEDLLAARTPLAAAAGHPAWRRDSTLPVVESGERLLGVLTREALERALRTAATRPKDRAQSSLAGVLARGYWEALSGVVLSAVALLPPAGAAGRRDDER